VVCHPPVLPCRLYIDGTNSFETLHQKTRTLGGTLWRHSFFHLQLFCASECDVLEFPYRTHSTSTFCIPSISSSGHAFPKPSLEIICNPSKRYTLDCYCIHENNICCKCSVIPRSSYLVEQITYPFSCGSILVAYQFETNAIRNPSVISDVCGCDITQYV
jgi:hypothetical protein